jgi:hypothetical protein
VEGDWRLPTRLELESLIHLGVYSPAVPNTQGTSKWANNDPFSSVQGDYYWTSSPYASSPVNTSWSITVYDGNVGGYTRTNPLYVWPVREGIGFTLPTPRFDNNGDGTVTDNLTGLIWLRDANCFGVQNWAAALNLANTLNSGECGLTDGSGEGDWRLPNRFELESVLHQGYYDPAVSNSAGNGKWTNDDPFANLRIDDYYWSSSSHAGNPNTVAWIVELANGGTNWIAKTHDHYVWAVRGGMGSSQVYLPLAQKSGP